MSSNNSKDITVVILTYNEELHLARCIQSLQNLVKRIVIVDSFSNDQTKQIAQQFNVDFYENRWNQNYAQQFNWALENCNITTLWTMRMDADEYLSPQLLNELNQYFQTNTNEVNGIVIPRNVIFKKKLIRFGGYFKIPLLRIWKTGSGKCEERWMDEHIVLNNPILHFTRNEVIDENLNSIHWWTIKHNNYARREAVDYLINKYQINLNEDKLETNKSASFKRHIKNNYYNSLPLFLRAFIYFIFRYFFNLGMLDGKSGLIWHFLQGFWYRFLVDVNIFEIEQNCQYNPELIKKHIINNWIN
ncbi:MAG: hypothetical protein RJA76_730 [Bacteroidota bacterium]|jgi:glycosyltransferase involved in cell wall biosynthesis